MKKTRPQTQQRNRIGRAKYIPNFPRSKEWTFIDFIEVNGIETNPKSKNFGKGPNCTMLTLRKWMVRAAQRKARSIIVRVPDAAIDSNSTDGLKRRAYWYRLTREIDQD